MGKSAAPILMGVAAMAIPAAATAIGPSLVGGLSAASTGGLTASTIGTTGLTMGQSLMVGISQASPMMMGLGGYSLGNMMTAQQPQVPDYGSMFQQQQGLLADQHSYGRKNTSDLEGLLEYGSTSEKNYAFDELQRRGEDSARLLEIQTRNDRTAENQDEIDRYVESATPPTEEEMQGLIATLKSSEYAELESDIDEEMTRVKQVMARRGLGSSNAIAQLEARLAEVEQKGKLSIDKDVQDRVLSFQQGVEGIRNEGLNRMLKGAGYEDTASRYNLQLNTQERNLQEGLRTSRTQQTNALGLEKFRADVSAMNNKYTADRDKARSDSMLGLGALGMGMQYFGNNNTPTTTPNTSVPYSSYANNTMAYSSAMPDANSFSNFTSGMPLMPLNQSEPFDRTGIHPNPHKFN